jgi:hypothetical protein
MSVSSKLDIECLETIYAVDCRLVAILFRVLCAWLLGLLFNWGVHDA